MSIWEIPRPAGQGGLAVMARAGRVTAVVGANGSGKSALGFWLERTSNGQGARVNRVLAHRRLWLEQAGPNITLKQRTQLTANIQAWNAQDESRWLDHANAQRADAALFDLIARHNERNSRLAELVEQGVPYDQIRERLDPSPLARMNRILEQAGLKVQIRLTEGGSLNAERADYPPYPISEMSDGEKSALLLVAEVLTAPSDSVQIIDEPERHLHRSISVGLIEAVTLERSDCHFVVLTHDLDLAGGLPTSSTTLVVLTECSWQGRNVTGWDAHIVDPEGTIPEAVRAAVLGGRKKILFVEGNRNSLDYRIFRLLYPGWTLHPAGGCEEVVRAVVSRHVIPRFWCFSVT